MFLTIIISLICVYLGYVILCHHFLPRINEQVPTFPGRLPLIGHDMWLKSETLVRSVISFGEYALKVGGVTKFFMGPLPVYVPIWKRNRRILDLSFKQHLLDEFLELFNERAGQFVELIAEDAGKGEVDLTEKITMFALETACRTTLGARVDGNDLVDNNYIVAIDELLDIRNQDL